MRSHEEDGNEDLRSAKNIVEFKLSPSILARASTKQNAMLNERRKMRRKPIVSPIDIYCELNSYRFGKGFAVDLSERGMKLITPECLGLGRELCLHFSLGDGCKFDFFGRIVHAEEAVDSIAYGIEFLPSQGTFLLRLWLDLPCEAEGSCA